jgi:hypothetical protein
MLNFSEQALQRVQRGALGPAGQGLIWVRIGAAIHITIIIADACNFDASIGADAGLRRAPASGQRRCTIIACCQTAAEAGIQYIIFNHTGLHAPGWIEMIGERVIPAVRDL